MVFLALLRRIKGKYFRTQSKHFEESKCGISNSVCQQRVFAYVIVGIATDHFTHQIFHRRLCCIMSADSFRTIVLTSHNTAIKAFQVLPVIFIGMHAMGWSGFSSLCLKSSNKSSICLQFPMTGRGRKTCQ